MMVNEIGEPFMDKMITKNISGISGVSIYDSFIIYFILLITAGFYFFQEANVALLVILLLLLMKESKLVITNSLLVWFSVLAVMMILSQIIGVYNFLGVDGGNVEFIASLLKLAIALLIVTTVSIAQFKVAYVKVLYLISCFSLICFGISLLDIHLFDAFPQLVNTVGIGAKFLIFTTVEDFSNSGFQRNQGIFWEPGVFQLFLTLAYILTLKSKTYDFKQKRNMLIIFTLAMLSTMSTTGFVSIGALSLYVLALKRNNADTMRLIIIGLIGALLFMLVEPFLGESLEYTLFIKFRQINDFFNGTNRMGDSAWVRVMSMMLPWDEFLKHPLFGIGEPGFNYITSLVGRPVFTFSPLNWLARYGMIYGGIMFYGIYVFFYNLADKSKHDATILTLVFLIAISSESVDKNIIILALALYGLKTRILLRKIDSRKGKVI